jgi:hypothetical protein
MLREAFETGDYFAVFSDSSGVVLWIDGTPAGLTAARSAGFVPGHDCSEAYVGTNAVGTSLYLDHPMQVFAAEHFSQHLQSLTCSAAPVRSPETRRTLGVINVSGPLRSGHPHSLSFVSSIARVIEATLVSETMSQDDALRSEYIDRLGQGLNGHSAVVTLGGRVVAASPKRWLGSQLPTNVDGTLSLPAAVTAEPIHARGGPEGLLIRAAARQDAPEKQCLAIKPLTGGRVRASIGEWTCDLSRRRSQLLLLLATHPGGLTAAELNEKAYGNEANVVTVRAEIARLRKLLGSVLTGDPYRLTIDVDADPVTLETAIKLQPLKRRVLRATTI